MDKLLLDIPHILPDEPKHTKLQIQQLLKGLEKTTGISQAHIQEGVPAKICVHYDPNTITVVQVEKMAKKQGLAIGQKSLNKENNEDHNHLPFGENTELYFAIGSGIFWLSGFILSFFYPINTLGLFIVFGTSIFLGGFYTTIEAYESIRKGKFEIDFLMLVAAAGAMILIKWNEAALLLFLFSLGHALEHYAMKRAKKSIAALTDLVPPVAHLIKNGQIEEIPVEDLKIGDIILVRPNSKIAADGVVLKGNSSVDQSPITGESIPVGKHPHPNGPAIAQFNELKAENRVFSGTINGSNALEIKVLRLTQDSTLARLIELVKEAEAQKSPTQQFTDRIERYYVPGVLIMVSLLLLAFLVIDEPFEASFYRAMSVLIAASPCALAISTPSAILSGIARAARQGVLIKGGRPLEALGNISAIAFDKTGTLTEGKPKLTHVIPMPGATKEQLLTVAVAVESLSDHPLASAIVEGGKEKLGEIDLPEAKNMQALIARGVSAQLDASLIYIGNRRLMEEVTNVSVPDDIEQQMKNLETQGHTAMIVLKEQQYLGIIAIMDVARKEAKSTLERLKKVGIRNMIMLTGDNQKVADAIAASIGITEAHGNLLPEQKVAFIKSLAEQEGKVVMVGDGVNDAPAMAKSTIGIAMGAAGSDVALETADIALMADKLDNLPFTIGLGKKAKQIIRQNLLISLGMVLILVPLTITGMVEIGPAVIGHEGSTLVVVANALRLLGYNAD
jgi:Cd2+/Zn2+-exporting ATPase